MDSRVAVTNLGSVPIESNQVKGLPVVIVDLPTGQIRGQGCWSPSLIRCWRRLFQRSSAWLTLVDHFCSFSNCLFASNFSITAIHLQSVVIPSVSARFAPTRSAGTSCKWIPSFRFRDRLSATGRTAENKVGTNESEIQGTGSMKPQMRFCVPCPSSDHL